ncbi:MAG: hypothetical protein WDN72_10150 [Alphaproteobacteria bacterium]
MWGASLLGVDRPHSPPIKPPWPNLLIASGRAGAAGAALRQAPLAEKR